VVWGKIEYGLEWRCYVEGGACDGKLSATSGAEMNNIIVTDYEWV
jgi:hypothetical protein